MPLASGREGGERGSPESEDLPSRLQSVPLAEGGNVLRRSFLVVLFVLLAAGCGGGGATESTLTAAPPLTTNPTAVLVTSDCGKTVVLKRTSVDPGQTAMRALDQVADIEADSGGKFVTGINGVEQNTGKKLAWLYYINGAAAQKGATEVKLAAGDVEWWDLHNYEHECASVPTAAK
jgi:Domain of unknown function (DUF4430)